MDRKTKAKWTALGNRLAATDAKKFHRVISQIEAIADCEELLAQFDHQLFLRPGRPTKRYLA